MPEQRKVGTFVVLSAGRADSLLVTPQHVNPITGATVQPSTLLNGQTPRMWGCGFDLASTLILVGGEWTGDQMFGLALLSHADGTGGTVLSHSEVLALLASEEWKLVEVPEEA